MMAAHDVSSDSDLHGAAPRILLVMEEVRCGGAELAFFALCRALGTRCEVHVAIPERSLENATLRSQCDALTTGPARVHRCKHLLNPGTAANLHRALRRRAAHELAELLRSFSFNIILANLPTVERGQAVLDAARLVSPRPPVWGYVHLSQPPSVIGAKLGSLRDRLVPGLLRRFDHLITVSHAGARELSRRYRLSLPDVVHPATEALSMVSPADRTRLRARHGLPEVFLLGVVGRVELHHKGQDAALRVTARLLGEGWEVHLVVVGDGPDLPALKLLAEQLGISPHVSFLGWRQDIATLIPVLNVVLMPSRYEGMPQTALQAATSGVPVIGYAVDGVAELLPTGFTVPYGDEAALAGAVVWLMQEVSVWPREELSQRAATWGDPQGAADHLVRLFRSRSI